MKKIMAATFVLTIVLPLICGCGGEKKPDGMPELVKANFKIVQEGTPLADAELTFYAQNGLAWNVFGRSNAKGEVKICTHKADFVGAPIGEYIVCVKKIETTPSQYGDNVPPPGDLATMQKWEAQRATEYRPSYYLVPPDCLDKETSPLTINVTAQGVEPATLDLGPAVRELFIPPGSAPEPGTQAATEEANPLAD